MRTAFGLVSRDENIYVHEPDERFLARLPADLAEEVRRSPMGYAWPVDDVMASFERLHGAWHGRDDRFRIVTAPDWTPACSDDLYRRCRTIADEHGTGMITHALETRSEMFYNLERYGKPGLQRLADIGVLDGGDRARALRVGDRRGAPDLRGFRVPSRPTTPGRTCGSRAASAGCATSWTQAAGSRSAPMASRSRIGRTSSRSSGSPATCNGCRTRSSDNDWTARRSFVPPPPTELAPSGWRTGSGRSRRDGSPTS